MELGVDVAKYRGSMLVSWSTFNLIVVSPVDFGFTMLFVL